MERNSQEYHENPSTPTRSSRNQRLYKEVYGRFDDLDNLPLEDNTDEIDMEKLKELVLMEPSNQAKNYQQPTNIIEERKRNLDEQKIYDINKILEKAKYENDKLKDASPKQTTTQINKQILSTLQSTELSLEEIKKASKNYSAQETREEVLQKKEPTLKETESNLSMTRELKYQNLMQSETNKTADLSLDLFNDLKPTENTIVTKPIQNEEEKSFSKVKTDFQSESSQDIDIIKSTPAVKDSDFFTSSYEFSKKDFLPVDDDFSELNQKSSILKIILLFLMIFVVGGVLTYFILTYGIGMS